MTPIGPGKWAYKKTQPNKKVVLAGVNGGQALLLHLPGKGMIGAHLKPGPRSSVAEVGDYLEPVLKKAGKHRPLGTKIKAHLFTRKDASPFESGHYALMHNLFKEFDYRVQMEHHTYRDYNRNPEPGMKEPHPGYNIAAHTDGSKITVHNSGSSKTHHLGEHETQ